MWTFIVNYQGGTQEVEAEDIESLFEKLGWTNPKVEFEPYSDRIKFKDMLWEVSVPSGLSGLAGRFLITIKI